jgi:hypothetical protein
MKNKLLKTISICLLFTAIFSIPVFAQYYDQTFDFTLNTFSTGRGFVDGGDNGQYYALSPGNVSLTVDTFSVTDTQTNTSSSGTCLVALLDGMYSYGSQAISSTSSTCSWYVSDDSTGYYLYANGQQPCTYKLFNVIGTIHDHS